MSIKLSINCRRSRQGGLSLVELIMFMVIVSIAVLGVVQVMNVTVRASVDPLLRKQALLIAESLLEEVELARFTYCEPSDDNAETAINTTIGASGCLAVVENVGPESGETRPYNNINDYVTQFGTAQRAFDNAGNALSDVSGTAVGAAAYTATLMIAPQALGGIASGAAPAAMEVLHITVTVSFGTDSVVLDGYRTRYAPNAI